MEAQWCSPVCVAAAALHRYKHMPEVRKVVKRRNLPAAIHKVSCGGSPHVLKPDTVSIIERCLHE
jgi:hypothetical protein